MTHAPSHVVARLLSDLGVGSRASSNQSWPIVPGQAPDSPDDLISIYNTVGRLQGRLHVTGETVEQPGLLLQVRSSRYPDGYAKIREIASTIDAVNRETVTIDSQEYLVQSITRTSSIIDLGEEPETKRRLFSLNAVVCLQPVS